MTIKPEVLAAIESLKNDAFSWIELADVCDKVQIDLQLIQSEILAMDAELTQLRTHHAEIAEAVKDARRYRWLKKNDNAYLLAEDVIDDAMHNSAREVGE